MVTFLEVIVDGLFLLEIVLVWMVDLCFDLLSSLATDSLLTLLVGSLCLEPLELVEAEAL